MTSLPVLMAIGLMSVATGLRLRQIMKPREFGPGGVAVLTFGCTLIFLCLASICGLPPWTIKVFGGVALPLLLVGLFGRLRPVGQRSG